MCKADKRKNKLLKNITAFLMITAIGFLPIVFGTSCENQGPSDETTPDTCMIAYVLIQPNQVQTSVGAAQIKFTAAAYDYEDRRIDPPPSFRFTCNDHGVRFFYSDQYAWLTPLTGRSNAIQVRAKCYDCDGEVHYADAEIFISNPTF